MKGKVKWFNDKLGYGFINSNKINCDIYVHYSDINICGYKTLMKGDAVEFKYDEELNKAYDINIIKSKRKVTI